MTFQNYTLYALLLSTIGGMVVALSYFAWTYLQEYYEGRQKKLDVSSLFKVRNGK